jgi:hypothetical protein
MFFPIKTTDLEFGSTKVVKSFAFLPTAVYGINETKVGTVWLEHYDRVKKYYGFKFLGWDTEYSTLAGEGKQLAVKLANYYGGRFIE